MVARGIGIGSRSSPIIIDDDDDDLPPPRAPVDPSSSTLPAKTLQEPIFTDTANVRDPAPARQENPDQLRNGIGYSILVRMGYKPGYGLGMNLEGIRPLQAILLGG